MKTKKNIEYIQKFTISGYSAKTRNKDELNPQSAKIPTLWQQLYAHKKENNEAIYGVYSDYESDASGFYTVTVGQRQENFDHSMAILSGQYLVFKNNGPMPQTVIHTWEEIWRYFSKKTAYQRLFLTDYECYPQHEEVHIYIGIK